ncbi:MAG: hypothetical protein C4536_06195 [Actinobacteria bacterium]|jgi:hypothetical protein|nr:MAG: hypothetical protein C4536_06195 [Actinomycetota bacterium]
MAFLRRPSVAICILMVLSLALFTFPLWSSHRLLYQGGADGSEVTDETFPAQQFASEHVKDGSITLWNPDIACGFPVLAEGQSGTLYPVNLLISLLFDPVLAFNLSIVIGLLLALIFSYLLLRHYGISAASSLFGAIAFTFSGFMIAKLKYPSLITATCWLPLAVFGLEKTFQRRHLAYLFLTSLALAMQFLAAGPQVFLITMSVIAVVFVFRFAVLLSGARREEQAAGRRMLAGLCVGVLFAVVLGTALAAPQLMPMTQGVPYLETAAADGSFYGSTGTTMRPRDLDLFIAPYRYGNPARATFDVDYDIFWENIAYPGLLTLVLALIAVLWLAKRDRTVQMWLLIGLLALAVSLGSNTPLAGFMWKYIPGFRFLYYFQRYLVVVVLCMAVLAGKGLDHVISYFHNGKAWKAAIILLVFATLLADLGLFATQQVSTIEAASVLEPNSTAELLVPAQGELQGQRIAVLGYGETWRRANEESGGWLGDKRLFVDSLRLLPADYSGVFAIPGSGIAGKRILASQEIYWIYATYGHTVQGQWRVEIPDTAVNLMATQSVRYLLSPYLIDNQSINLVKEEGAEIEGVTYRLYEIPYAAPRAFIASEILLEEGARSMTVADAVEYFWDPLQIIGRVILEREPTLLRGRASQGEAHIVSSGDTRVVIEAHSPNGGVLVLNDSYFPEWKVYVDGQEREILRANLAFRALELEAGDHSVEFVYRPSSLYYGLVMAAAVLLLLLCIFLYHRQCGWLDLEGEYYAGIPREQGDAEEDGEGEERE